MTIIDPGQVAAPQGTVVTFAASSISRATRPRSEMHSYFSHTSLTHCWDVSVVRPDHHASTFERTNRDALLHDTSWRIDAVQLRPSPGGERIAFTVVDSRRTDKSPSSMSTE